MLVAISAASDGVAALLSETKSAIVVSVSCPTAVIIGILELYICLAKNSLLYSIKSSSDPPPLAIIITSEVFFLFMITNCFMILDAQFSPWTLQLYISILIPEILLSNILSISCNTEPVS